MIRAIVGAGGKTTLVKKYAKEGRLLGKKVFVTTSTHMFLEPETVLGDDASELIRQLEHTGYVMGGIEEGKKIRALSEATYEAVCRHADLVLVEADGSKHMPLKIPRKGEPVIYENVEEIVIVCGLHGLGKKASEAVFRLEELEKLQNRINQKCVIDGNDSESHIITLEDIKWLILYGYVIPLQEKYPHMKLKAAISCHQEQNREEEAKQLKEMLLPYVEEIEIF